MADDVLQLQKAGDALSEAQQRYRVAYEAHQSAPVGGFQGTLEAWRAAWLALDQAEHAAGLAARAYGGRG